MTSFFQQNTFSIKIITLIVSLFFSCSDPDQNTLENPISDPQFTFQQDQNTVYFSANIKEQYQGDNIDSTFVRWYGPDLTGGFDIIVLNDDGVNGDIIEGDKIFARKILNSSLIKNEITDTDTGFLYADYTAVYEGNYIGLVDSNKIGNLIPKIISISAGTDTTMNDTLFFRPEGRNISFITVQAEVTDGDGKETIKWVGFTSYSLRDNEMMNNGNLIYLYNDGGSEILYPPDFTSGDDNKDDDIYTFKIPIYGTGFGTQPTDDTTRTGSFRWRFSAQDLANDYSQTIDHVIIIQ
tara:strand:+ start:575 stop:1459 length:885 start_codon:yes stop_codon:yes gene_type:complete